jgi:hypothetical protein
MPKHALYRAPARGWTLLVAAAFGASATACGASSAQTPIADDAGSDAEVSGSGPQGDAATGATGAANPDSSISPTHDSGSGAADATSPLTDTGTGAADSSSPASGDDAMTYGDANAGVSVTMEVTFYGWDDNSPPGNAISYPTIHSSAGGVGTYADPITFATDKKEYPPGTILYVPFIEKYVIMEDDCVQCDSDWSSMMRHIDIWMNSDGTESSNSLFNCEDSWTMSSAQVVTSPPANLVVTTAPLFDPSTNTCRTTP